MSLFSKRRSAENSKIGDFTLFNKEVSLVTTVKYLGVILDNKLTWIPHLEEKLNKAIGIFWWIYTAIVRPMLCHGCVVWWPRVEVQWSKKRLDKLQRLACLCMTGAKNTVATIALETLLDLPPLDLYIKTTALNAFFNIRINECWQPSLVKGHTTIQNLIRTEEMLMPSDQMKPVVMLDDEFEWLIPEREEWLGEVRLYPRSDSITCYTDGSKNDGFSGAGYFCEYFKLSGSIQTGSIATLHQAELFAISELCNNEVWKDCVDKKICICSDSQFAIEAVSSNLVKSKMVYECKQRLNGLGSRNKVTLIWVPGHEGISGNEKADELARLGAENRFIRPEPKFGISMTTRKHLVKNWLRNEHCRTWSDYDGARHTKIFFGNPSKEISQAPRNLSRTDIKRVVEVVTNHCGLNKHLFNIGYADSPRCLCNHGEETGYHIIIEFPRYRTFRWRIFNKHELLSSDLKLERLEIGRLAEFLKLTRRLT